MNSDTRSIHSVQMGHAKLPLRQNNLMGTGNDFAGAAAGQHHKFNSSMNEGAWGGNGSQFSDSRGMLSNYAGSASGSNMFHPRARESA